MPRLTCACNAPIAETRFGLECQGKSFCEVRSTGREEAWLNSILEDTPFRAIEVGDFVQLPEGWREVLGRQGPELVFGRGRTRKVLTETYGTDLVWMVRRPPDNL